jgi:hypothetical protein
MPPSRLTPFQVEVARLFFSLPETRGFLLAGGAALVAHRLIDRPTQDLDLFTHPGGRSVVGARDAFEAAAAARGWVCRRIRDTSDFCRLVVHGTEDLLVDIALDSPPERPTVMSSLGPTFAPEELAGRKLLALFDRGEARDFADVYRLAGRYGRDRLVAEASSIDAGFDIGYAAFMLRSLGRFEDQEVPVAPGEVAALREFFAEWSGELSAR